MIRRVAYALVSIGVLASSLPVQAQGLDQDVRCLLLSNFYAEKGAEPKAKQFAQLSSFYYLGRVGARLSADALKAQLMAQANSLKGQNVAQIMTACARQASASQHAVLMMEEQMAHPTTQAK